MDSIERLKEAIQTEKIQEVPVIPLAGQWIAKFSGIPIKDILQRGDKLFEAQVKAYEAVHYDALFGYCETLYIPEALGCQLKILTTGFQVVPISIRTVEDIDRLPIPKPERDGRLPEILKAVQLLSKYSNEKIPVLGAIEGPFTTAARITETDDLMRKVIKDGAFVHRFLEKITDILIASGKAIVEHGADVLFIPDPVASSSMISPKAASEIAFPYIERLIKSLKVPCILHICGDSTRILEMMVKTGASVLSVDQCMDLSLVRQKVGWGVTVGGNIDPIHVMQLGTQDDVQREVNRCLTAGGNRRFVLMTGCSISPNTPLENLKTIVLTARGFRFS
jgi:uroporphyrinogen decarboxylase